MNYSIKLLKWAWSWVRHLFGKFVATLKNIYMPLDELLNLSCFAFVILFILWVIST